MGTEQTSQEGVAGADVDTVRLLYVDGDRDTRDEVAAYAATRSDVVVTTAADGAAAEKYLADAEVDCVVAEYDLPEADGLALYESLTGAGYDDPFVLYTTRSPAAVAREAFDAGVDDFVRKRPDADGYEFLLDKVRGAVEGEGLIDEVDGQHGDRDTLVALADETNSEVWTDGELPGLPSLERVYDAVAEILRSDTRFRTTVADTTGEGVWDARTWAREDDGAIEHQRIELPERVGAAERLDLFRDVSDAVERRERLQRFERLLDTASDGLYALDPNGHYTYVNEQMAETLGYDREEMVGMHAGTVLTGEEYERGQQVVSDLTADAERESDILEMTVERADESELPVAISFSPLYDDAGNYDGLVGVMRDVSERRKRERERRKSERRYRTLAENVPNGGVAMFDGSLTYLLVEGELFDDIGYDPEEFEGATIEEVHTEGFVERFGPKYEAVFDGERSEFEFGHAGRYYRTHLVPIRDGDGNIEAGLALTMDVTEQREYERELERQNERLGEFASIVSHDLRNPLNVIEGRLALYREQGDEQHLDRVEDGIDRMTDLIDDLLELARSGRTLGETEPLDLEQAASTCWDTVETDGATLSVSGTTAIVGDPSRLHQLFENLYRNAVEHGTVDDERLTVEVGPLDDEPGFYVADDGCGIPESERDEVFDYGVSEDEDGTGIGLAIVREIAEAHGWSVRVTESSSGGARFEFTDVELDR